MKCKPKIRLFCTTTKVDFSEVDDLKEETVNWIALSGYLLRNPQFSRWSNIVIDGSSTVW